MISISKKNVNIKNLKPVKFSPCDESLDPWILSEIALIYDWSPTVFKNNYRKTENFLYSDWCVLDFDESDMTLNDARDTFKDCIGFIGTTKSHQINKTNKDGKILEGPRDRFRVALAWESRIEDAETSRYSTALIGERYGCDTKCFEPARFYFPCTKIIDVYYGDYFQSVISPSSGGLCVITNPDRVNTHFGLSDIANTLLTYGITNQNFMHRRNDTIFKAALDLLRHGYSETELENLIKSKTDIETDAEKKSILKSAVKQYKMPPPKFRCINH
jgi:hypothetical protein